MNRKLKQNLNEIYITNNSFYENEKGKLFIGGYSDIYNSRTTQMYVINIKNQIIETIIKWSLFEVIVGRKFKCAWSFINVKDKLLLWFVPNGNIDEDTLEIKKYSTRIYEWIGITKTYTYNNLYLSLSNNKDYLRIWTIK